MCPNAQSMVELVGELLRLRVIFRHEPSTQTVRLCPNQHACMWNTKRSLYREALFLLLAAHGPAEVDIGK
ncbi:unnamed protein product [Protopolystoma xenopodis]|uniref:Uncharacterized protein n=1 Tax=Protopolystoma xenopodis TaxID=117903 RepID=A0A448WLP2_9PLAT|nr:unnamed protein product [Protopolystoma xenopodis]